MLGTLDLAATTIGKKIPGINIASTVYDIASISIDVSKKGQIDTGNLYGIASTALGIAGIGMLAVATAPVGIVVATSVLVAGVGIGIYGQIAGETVDLIDIKNDLISKLEILSDKLEVTVDGFITAVKNLGDEIVELGLDLTNWLNQKLDYWIEKWSESLDFLSEFLGLNRDGKFNIYDPLVLDLDGDGIELIGHNQFQGALFDFDANGIKNATGWVKADDGLLVFDKNNNGVIDSGLELFGDATILKDGTKAQHGFMALADLDSNGDGKIDANDADFDKLKIWRDLNGDGISQEGELFTLSELGIQSLNLDYQNINQNLSNGNSLSQIGSFTKTDGTTGKMGDVHFAFDSVYSQYAQPIELTAEQMEVANLKGIGRVRDLRRFVEYIDDNQYVDIKSLQAA